MTEKDFAISVTAAPPVGHISKKPCYLITLEESSGKGKSIIRFIAIDKPAFETTFIQVKGVYSLLGEEEITKRFSEIIASTPKEEIVDMMFPSHRVHSIRSLVFNANKPSTLIK
jgi:hypothetical protein